MAYSILKRHSKLPVDVINIICDYAYPQNFDDDKEKLMDDIIELGQNYWSGTWHMTLCYNNESDRWNDFFIYTCNDNKTIIDYILRFTDWQNKWKFNEDHIEILEGMDRKYIFWRMRTDKKIYDRASIYSVVRHEHYTVLNAYRKRALRKQRRSRLIRR